MPLKTTLKKDEYQKVKLELDQVTVRLDESELTKVRLSEDDGLKTRLNKNDVIYVKLEE